MSRNRENTDDKILVQFQHLTKTFGNFTAVSDVNLNIYKGEIVGFLGPNGAGKSTTMKMMAYLLKPNEGKVLIRHNGDLEVLNSRTKDYLLDKIGFLIENPAFYGKMTPRQILTYFAGLKGYPNKSVKTRVEEVVQMVGMSNWIDKKIGSFSKGMRQKIGVVSAIVHDPDIVVLDEPHTGLDPTARMELRDFILKLREMGKTIFLSSHLLYEVSEVADRIAIISNGKIIALDNLDNLEAQAKRSIIDLEIYELNGDSDKILEKLKKIIYPISGLSENENQIIFKPDTEVFEILFNGSPKTQLNIFKSLFKNGIDVIEFSVPKAGLLESLYIQLVKKDQQFMSTGGI